MTNSVVLSFHDSLLRNSDYELLDEGRWLNDNVIAFAFEYFEKELFAKFANSVTFLSPDVGQFIKLANKDEDVGVFLEPLSLKSKDYVFVPVNNNSNPASFGGSHWSLLVYDRPLDHFEHFDSSDDMNRSSAEQLAAKLQPYLNASSGLVHSHETPRQQNAHDCGVYVIAITEHLCHQLLTSYRPSGRGQRRDSEETDSLAYSLTPERITQTRHELRELINTLAAASAKH